MSLSGFISTGWLIFIGILVLGGLYNFVIAPMLSRKNFSKIASALGLSRNRATYFTAEACLLQAGAESAEFGRG